MSKTKTWDDSWSIGDGYSRIHRHRNGPDDWHAGTVVTPDGFVEVYAQDGHSDYRVVLNGREHQRSENVRRTPRGLVIMARRFMRELEADR